MNRILAILIRPFFLLGLLVFISLSSCTHEPRLIEGMDPVCFSSEVLPVLQSSCGKCHSYPGEETNFSTADYNSIMEIVKPGNARGSKLYKVITAINSENMMPPDRPLSEAQRTLIMVWIEQGAEDVKCTGQDTTSPVSGGTPNDSVCFAQTIQPLIVSSCATTGCHDAASALEGYVLTDYSHITGSKNAVVPYYPDQSKLYRVLSETGEDRMPPSPRAPLTSEQKNLIRKWIADGALNSDCPDASCDTTGEILFADQVFPILDLACVGCHNNSSSSGGVNLSDYPHVSAVAGTMVNNVSRLKGVIRKEPGFNPMPPSGSLGECDIRKIELWIEQGMKNN
jgi:hypothetical protein